MKYTKLLAIALSATLFLGSCDDDDDDHINVPSVVENSFSQQYPEAMGVNWEKDTENSISYLKAEFKQNGVEVEAWYNIDGTWVKTETDFFGNLPTAVADYIATHYNGFRTDDMEYVETPTEKYYKIELEQGKHEVELMITETGEVLFISDNQAKVPADVLKSFQEKYPNVTVKSWEKEGHLLKAEFYTGKVETEVWFTYNGTWVKTETDFYGELPKPINDYLAAQYAGYRVEDVNFVETPEKNYYEIDIEKGKEEIELSIMKDGSVIAAVPDLD